MHPINTLKNLQCRRSLLSTELEQINKDMVKYNKFNTEQKRQKLQKELENLSQP